MVGAGGMGEVYRARDTRLNRDVALKVLPDSFASDPDRVARFSREAVGPRVAQSSAHRAHLWARSGRAGDGVRGRRGFVSADRARPNSARRRPPHCPSDRRCPRRGARARHHPSGSEAGQRESSNGRHGESPRLRAGQGDGPRRPRRSDRLDQFTHADCPRNAARGDSRHCRLHGARAGQRQAGRPSRGHLGVWRRALRDVDGAARIRRR